MKYRKKIVSIQGYSIACTVRKDLIISHIVMKNVYEKK